MKTTNEKVTSGGCFTHVRDISQLNVLTQQRSKLKDIPEFAESLGGKPLCGSPIWVNKITSTDSLICYLNDLNEIFRYRGANHQIADVIAENENGQTVWYVLIAGERRISALSLVKQGKTSSLTARYPKLTAEEAFQIDYPHGIEAMVWTNLSAEEAIILQGIENQREAVDARDLLDLLRAQFEIAKKKQPSISIAAFARQHGLSETTTANRIRFHQLAKIAQDAVFDGLLTIEHGNILLNCQTEWIEKLIRPKLLTEVQEILHGRGQGESEEKQKAILSSLLSHVQRQLVCPFSVNDHLKPYNFRKTDFAILDRLVKDQTSILVSFIRKMIVMATETPRRMPVATFREKVKTNLGDVLTEQGNLFADFEFSAKLVEQAAKRLQRQRHKELTLAGMKEIVEWTRRITWLKERGLIGREEEGWRDQQVRNGFDIMLQSVAALTQLLSTFLTEDAASRSQETVEEGQKALAELDRSLELSHSR